MLTWPPAVCMVLLQVLVIELPIHDQQEMGAVMPDEALFPTGMCTQ